jgi:hypothetical protein
VLPYVQVCTTRPMFVATPVSSLAPHAMVLLVQIALIAQRGMFYTIQYALTSVLMDIISVQICLSVLSVIKVV